ncbi:hypothetical protein B5M42_007250 [Paenibacillus athensensis]|uniref:Butirosin biosynthesis protein H N-terminal domain-containing protein n=1 Tax=Paenibacillus athensensis TaxID=1967502 RepID=A0A4Y8Q3H4_9BACL|nr:hypothetical protein [Paenibacillus athensensis]MCD1258628.1 hypothetical protein [Paenibacillus athensensis]
MNANLSKEYYVRHDGVFDDFVPQLNCFQAALYFVLRAKTGMSRPYELFVQDPSYCLNLDAEGRYRELRLAERWQCFEVFQTHDVKGQGDATMAEIEAMLDAGDIVIFETFLNRVPHMRDFLALDFPFQPEMHNTPHNHIFVALGYSDTHLYYVEAPFLLNANHVPYNNSPCVGMIEKSVLRHATDCFLNYRRVEIKEDGLRQNLQTRVVNAIRSLLDNAVRPVKESPEGVIYYGAEAIDQLVECCRNGAFAMKRSSTLYQTSEGEVLEWKLGNVRQQKTLLHWSIEKNQELFGDYAPGLLKSLKETLDACQMTASKLRLMLLKKQEDTTAVQGMLLRMKEGDLRFQELAERWYALAGATAV